MKPMDVVGSQGAAQQVKADSFQQSPRLVRQGLSEFQKMWAAVYQETEQATRNSGVGEPPTGGSSEGRAVDAHASDRNVPTPPAGSAIGRMTSGVTSAARGGGASSGGAQAINFGAGLPVQWLSAPAENQEMGAGMPVNVQAARFAAGSTLLSSFLPPVLPGTKGVMPPELLASPLFTQETGAPIPMEAADVAAFRAVLDQLRALDPKTGQTAVLQLPPDALGNLTVEVSVTGREVRTDWTTSNPEVKALLDGNQVWLRDALAQQGLNVEHFSVNVGDPNGYFEEADRRMRQEGRALEGQPFAFRPFVQVKKIG